MQKLRLRTFSVLMLLILPLSAFIVHAQSEDTPPQLITVINDMSTYLGRPITAVELTSFRWEQDFYNDTNLGCALLPSVPTTDPIGAYTFTLVLAGVSYDWRVSLDNRIVFPCDARLLAQGRSAPQLLPTIPPELAADTACPSGFSGFLRPRLVVGGQAQVEEGGLPNRLRNAPSRFGAQIGVINPQRTVNVLAGPACEIDGNLIWWQVEIDGIVGWTAEGALPDNYFLEPVGDSSFSAQAAAPLFDGDVIDSLNVGRLELFASFDAEAVALAWSPDSRSFGLAGAPSRLLSFPELANSTRFDEADLSIGAGISVAFNFDGSQFAIGTQSNGVVAYPASGQTRTLAIVPNGSATSLAYYGPSVLVAGVDDAAPAVWLWDIADLNTMGTPLSRTVPRETGVRAVAISPDGALVAGLDASELFVMDAATNDLLTSLRLSSPNTTVRGDIVYTDEDPISYLAYFTDGTAVRLLNLNTGDEESFIPSRTLFAEQISLNADGSLIAILSARVEGNRQTGLLTIMDTARNQILYTVGGIFRDVAFSPDGRVLAAITDSSIDFYTVPFEGGVG
jgi:Bacterial SH3 domain